MLTPHIQANAQASTFCNTIKEATVTNVQIFLETKFDTPEQIEQYVKLGKIYYGKIPFLYKVFDPTNICSMKEKSTYKVVSGLSPSIPTLQAHSRPQTHQGLFQQQAILNTMLIYYAKGVKQCLPTVSSPGTDPVGGLALVCTTVGVLSPPFHCWSLTPHSTTGRACVAHVLDWALHSGQEVLL